MVDYSPYNLPRNLCCGYDEGAVYAFMGITVYKFQIAGFVQRLIVMGLPLLNLVLGYSSSGGGGAPRKLIPELTNKISPVVLEARSEHRKTAAFPTSSVVIF